LALIGRFERKKEAFNAGLTGGLPKVSKSPPGAAISDC
jgi:hypothetical protein